MVQLRRAKSGGGGEHQRQLARRSVGKRVFQGRYPARFCGEAFAGREEAPRRLLARGVTALGQAGCEFAD